MFTKVEMSMKKGCILNCTFCILLATHLYYYAVGFVVFPRCFILLLTYHTILYYCTSYNLNTECTIQNATLLHAHFNLHKHLKLLLTSFPISILSMPFPQLEARKSQGSLRVLVRGHAWNGICGHRSLFSFLYRM